jgi:hypothetical protein
MSYTALIDPDSDRLRAAEASEHAWVANGSEMQTQSAALYRRGYVMVGFSYMVGSHLPAFAPSGAKSWGRKLDAERILQMRQGSVYLATYWRSVRGFELGAYYVDAPPAAHELLGERIGVVVQEVVQRTPADTARLMPGDLLIALDDEVIPDARWLDGAIADRPGEEVTLLVWPMLGVEPVKMKLELGSASAF